MDTETGQRTDVTTHENRASSQPVDLENGDSTEPEENDNENGDSAEKADTSRLFKRSRQRLWLFLYLLWRWTVTAAVCVGLAGTLVGFSSKTVMTVGENHAFNALSAAAFIGLSINLSAATSHMAGKAKWRFMAMRSWPPEQFELVMNLASPSAVIKLIWRAEGAWMVRLICMSWLAIGLAAQVAITLLGLAYQTESAISNALSTGESPAPILSRIGKGIVADWSYIGDNPGGVPKGYVPQATWDGYDYQPAPGSDYYLSAQRAAANTYGLQSTEYGNTVFKNNSNLKVGFYELTANDTYPSWFWVNPLIDFPLNFTTLEHNVAVSRIIGTYAHCEYLTLGNATYGDTSTIAFTKDNQTETYHIANDIRNSTTYISDSTANYGPRSTRVIVYWSGLNDTTLHEAHGLFDCNSTVTNVLNFGKPGHPIWQGDPALKLNDTQARILAGAIGWSGIDSNSPYQTHTYPVDSRWSLLSPGVTAPFVQSEFVSRFSAGAILAFNVVGPRQIAPHIELPHGGSVLVVQWGYAVPILAVLAGGHLALVLLVLWLCDPVVVLEESAYVSALLVRPLLEGLSVGRMLKGREMAREMPGRVRYGWEEGGKEGVRELVVREGVRRERRTRFGDAWYD